MAKASVTGLIQSSFDSSTIPLAAAPANVLVKDASDPASASKTIAREDFDPVIHYRFRNDSVTSDKPAA